jgi:hypothetical protein
MRTCSVHSQAEPETSRFPRKELSYMPGSPTTPDLQSARDDALQRIAFRHHKDVGIRDHGLFVAQLLAYTLPYRRFANALASADARLGADVDRYSFIVSDLHRLLLAGLPAHYGPPRLQGYSRSCPIFSLLQRIRL